MGGEHRHRFRGGHRFRALAGAPFGFAAVPVDTEFLEELEMSAKSVERHGQRDVA